MTAAKHHCKINQLTELDRARALREVERVLAESISAKTIAVWERENQRARVTPQLYPEDAK